MLNRLIYGRKKPEELKKSMFRWMRYMLDFFENGFLVLKSIFCMLWYKCASCFGRKKVKKIEDYSKRMEDFVEEGKIEEADLLLVDAARW